MAVLSAAVVASNLMLARIRFERLRCFAEPLPARVRDAVARATAEFGSQPPVVLFLDITEPVAATVFARTILLSRGFVEPLDDFDLDSVVRHEVAHVRNGDANAGIFWYLAFAALLMPGFEPLERRLHARREQRANVLAAAGREERYVALLSRIAGGTELCAGARLGLDASRPRASDPWLVWLAPAAVALLAVGLPLSHVTFRHDLPYLLTHHC